MKTPWIMAILLAASVTNGAETNLRERVAPKPLYRDPVYDGAADPVVVWNRAEKRWFMLYTNRRANLLAAPGKGQDDQVKGGHPDLVINGDRAWLFYFTHPGRRGPDADKDTTEQRRSSIQVAEVELRDGWLTCYRDRPARIRLAPP